MKRFGITALALLFLLVGGLGVGPAAAAPPKTEGGHVAIGRLEVDPTSPMQIPGGFDLVGASLPKGTTPPHLEIRTFGEGGWSKWSELNFDPDEGPDGGSRDLGSSPIWAGDATRFQLRAEDPASAVTLKKLRIDWVRSDTGPSRRLALGALFVSPVSAAPSRPAIFSRADWGANEAMRTSDPSYASSLKMAFIHHTAGTNSYSASESPAIVRGIYHYHVNSRGWSDLGYNFLVDRYGQIFEGRYGGIDRAVVGAHAGGFNTGSTGISLMGDFSAVSPTAQMEDATKRLLAWKLDIHHVDPTARSVMRSGGSTRFAEGTMVTLNNVSGHRDVSTTTCPGGVPYSRLADYASSAYSIGLPKMFDASYNRSTGTFSARFSTAMNWQASVIRRLNGIAVRTWTGTGDAMSATWDGRDAAGQPLATGAYVLRITGSSASGIPTPYETISYVIRDHPDGSALIGPDGNVWMLEGGKKRKIVSPGVLESRIRWSEVISVPSSEISRYPTGSALGFREGSLIYTSDGAVWLISNGARRHIVSPKVFDDLGFEWWSVREVSAGEANLHAVGAPIGDGSIHPDGTLMMNPSGTVFVMETGLKRPVPSVSVFESRFKWHELVMISSERSALYPSGAPLGFRDGALIHASDGGTYVISNGMKRHVLSPDFFRAMGYLWGNVLGAYRGEPSLHPTGDPIG